MTNKASLRPLGHADYLQLRTGAEVIEADRHGEKVLLLADGNYLKLFRRKRLLTSATFYPYARRFAYNLNALAERGIPCPEIVGLYRIRSIARDAAHYQALAGRTVRQLLKAGPDATESDRLRAALGDFVAELHDRGVYFRSLHLGNVVLTPDDRFGLIDVADMTTRRRPLGRFLRARNLKHLHRYKAEAAWLFEGGTFLDAYHRRSGFRLG